MQSNICNNNNAPLSQDDTFRITNNQRVADEKMPRNYVPFPIHTPVFAISPRSRRVLSFVIKADGVVLRLLSTPPRRRRMTRTKNTLAERVILRRRRGRNNLTKDSPVRKGGNFMKDRCVRDAKRCVIIPESLHARRQERTLKRRKNFVALLWGLGSRRGRKRKLS